MSFVRDLLEKQMPGQRWDVTRHVVTTQPESAAETEKGILADLGVLDDLLGAEDCEKQSHVIDVRITSEHLVLLLGRMIPAVNTVAADLYMTVVSDIENDLATPRVPASLLSWRNDLARLRSRWKALENRNLQDDGERARTILDFALIIAQLNVLCIQALDELLRCRF